MTKRGVIKWTALGVGGVLVAGLVLLFTMDLGFLRGMVEDQVRQATGREFTIRGPVSIRLGRELKFEASGIELGNTAWAGPNAMAEIDTLQLRIQTASLLGGVIINEARVDGARLNLVQDEAGRANWEFAQAGDSSAPGLTIRKLNLSDTQLHLASPRLDKPLQLDIDSLEESVADDGFLAVNLEATLNGADLRFKGRAGPYEKLVKGRDVEIEGEGALGQTTVGGSARIDDLAQPRRPEFTLSADGPSLQELTTMLGIEGLGEGVIALNASAKPATASLALRVEGRLGALQADVTAHVASLDDLSEMRLNGTVSGPNFGRLARLAGFDGWPESAFKANTDLQRSGAGLHIETVDLELAGARLQVNGEVPAYPALAGADLALGATGQDLARFRNALGMPDAPAGPFQLGGQVHAGDDQSTRLDLNFETPLAGGKVRGTLGGGKDLVGTALEVEARGNDARALSSFAGLPPLRREAWTLKLNLGIERAGWYELRPLVLNSKGLNADLRGSVNAERPAEAFDLNLELGGDRMADFQGLAGDALALPDKPFKLAGKAASRDAAWQLSGFRGEVDGLKFQLDGLVGTAENLAGTNFQLHAEGRGLQGIVSAPEPLRVPDGPFRLDSHIRITADRLDVSDAAFEAGPLSVKGSANLPWPEGSGGMRFALDASGQDITRVLGPVNGVNLLPAPWQARFAGQWDDEQLRVDPGEMSVGDSRLSARGTVDLPPNLSATRLDFEFRSPNIARLARLDNPLWNDTPVLLQAGLNGTATRLSAQGLRAEFGKSVVTGQAEVDFQSDIPRFTATLAAPEFDLRPFQSDGSTAGETNAAERMIPELAWPMDVLAAYDGHFEVRADRLLLKDGALRAALLAGDLQGGKLSISELGADGFKGRLALKMGLSPASAGTARLVTDISTRGFIYDLAGLTAEQKAASPAFDATIHLEGAGAGLRETTATLSGNILVESKGGEVRRRRKDDGQRKHLLADVIAAISPEAARRDVINISCFAAKIPVQGGQLRLDPGIAVQSDKLNVFARGNVNLGTEKLDINFSTQTRKAVDVSASELFSPYVKLSGTLAAPSVALDKKGTLLSGGAAYLSGGLSILAKKALDQIEGTEDPCAGVIAAKAAETP